MSKFTIQAYGTKFAVISTEVPGVHISNLDAHQAKEVLSSLEKVFAASRHLGAR
jgi:hypothetical protein